MASSPDSPPTGRATRRPARRTPPPTAIVVGGGIGGLAAAIALIRAGVDVTVVERAAALRTGGTGLWLWPNALRALDGLGVGDAARAAGVVQTANRVRDVRGRTLIHVYVAMRDGRPYASLCIQRGALLAALSAALPPGTVRFGAAVAGIETGDRAAPAHVRFADGSARTADLVVGADGVGSSVRRALFGSAGRRETGSTAFRAVVAHPGAAALEGGVVWGRGARCGVLPVGPDAACWFAGFAAPPALARGAALAVVKERLAGWPGPIGALLAATRPDDVRVDRIAFAVPPPAWSRGRVALLGDAAHAMTPSLGQGAGQALEDAVALGQALAADADDVPAALRRYERRRRRRAEAVAARSIRMDRLVDLESALLCALRDRAVAAAPDAIVRRFHRAMWGLPWR